MSADPTMIATSEVKVGDKLQSRDGTVFTVTRIDASFPLAPGMVSFVEDSAERWFKMPAMADGEVPLVARAS